MLKDYKPREYHTIVEYGLRFFYDDNGGFEFPCDAAGNVCISEMEQCAVDNLMWCMAHPEKFQTFGEVQTYRRRVADPAHGKCSCGREVFLWDQYMGACECECGRWYNLFGQELLPPEEWEE